MIADVIFQNGAFRIHSMTPLQDKGPLHSDFIESDTVCPVESELLQLSSVSSGSEWFVDFKTPTGYIGPELSLLRAFATHTATHG